MEAVGGAHRLHHHIGERARVESLHLDMVTEGDEIAVHGPKLSAAPITIGRRLGLEEGRGRRRRRLPRWLHGWRRDQSHPQGTASEKEAQIEGIQSIAATTPSPCAKMGASGAISVGGRQGFECRKGGPREEGRALNRIREERSDFFHVYLET